MTRKATPNAKSKPAKPKAITVYTVVRPIPAESPTFSEPDRVFATKAAAKQYADELNRQLRALTNPFGYTDPDSSMTGGEKAFVALLKKHKLPVPTKQKGHGYIEWESWWDRHYFDMTDDQREMVWLAQNKYDWYEVQETTIE